MTKQVIVVTGASSGFGAMTARALATAGHTVYAGMRATETRNAKAVADAAAFATEHDVDLRSVELDVASDTSVEAGIARIVADAGRLDVIMHNAGHMSFGPAEAFTPEQFAELFDVNVLSTQRVNRARCRNCGRRGRGWWSGSPRAARGAARRPISRPTSRRRRRWTAWPSPMPAS
jgi:NAD(P)-dependent dehydrogenase (short-subunit alcohol dehydrogenase family)